mmetsp:Transcript_95896/g.133148  ORF Transcript_95896/g.133148 Transcript_95896/m.133148 type:complete len:206 (-) Transcript_95896:613-1230(-)
MPASPGPWWSPCLCTRASSSARRTATSTSKPTSRQCEIWASAASAAFVTTSCLSWTGLGLTSPAGGRTGQRPWRTTQTSSLPSICTFSSASAPRKSTKLRPWRGRRPCSRRWTIERNRRSSRTSSPASPGGWWRPTPSKSSEAPSRSTRTSSPRRCGRTWRTSFAASSLPARRQVSSWPSTLTTLRDPSSAYRRPARCATTSRRC